MRWTIGWLKGKKLSAPEKMKNHLFSLWKEENFSKKKSAAAYVEDIRFPKAWLEMKKKEHIPDELLYDTFRKELSSDNLKEFLEAGKTFNEHLIKRENINSALKNELQLYDTLGVTTGDALILSWLLSKNEHEDKIGKKLHRLNTIYFLLYVMDRNGNDKKSINGKLPKLAESEELSLEQNDIKLIQISIDENAIKQTWDDFVCTYDFGNARRNVARFLLLKIENWINPENEAIFDLLTTKNKQPEIEHIRPISNPAGDLNVNFLENICLLEKNINASVKDAPLVSEDKSKLGKKEGKGTNQNNNEGKPSYKNSIFSMPKMFYDKNDIPRWYDNNGEYGSEEAKLRMEEIWDKVKESFRKDVTDVLPKT